MTSKEIIKRELEFGRCFQSDEDFESYGFKGGELEQIYNDLEILEVLKKHCWLRPTDIAFTYKLDCEFTEEDDDYWAVKKWLETL